MKITQILRIVHIENVEYVDSIKIAKDKNL